MPSRVRPNTLALTVDICLRYLYYILDSLGKHCLHTLLRESPYKNAPGLYPVSKKALQLPLNFQSTFLRYIQLNLWGKPSPYHVEATLCCSHKLCLTAKGNTSSIRDRGLSGKLRYHWELSLSGSIYGHVTTPYTISGQHFTLHRNWYWRSRKACELFRIQGWLLCMLNTPLCAKHFSPRHTTLRNKSSCLVCWSRAISQFVSTTEREKKMFFLRGQVDQTDLQEIFEGSPHSRVTSRDLDGGSLLHSCNYEIFTGWCPYRPWETWIYNCHWCYSSSPTKTLIWISSTMIN